jgi:hypothetical protein
LRAWKPSLRGGPMTRRTVHHVVAEAAKRAGIGFPVHPHMLRHATGYYLANAGPDTRAIQLYWATRIFSTRSAIPNCRPPGSRISGRTSVFLARALLGYASTPVNTSLPRQLTSRNLECFS